MLENHREISGQIFNDMVSTVMELNNVYLLIFLLSRFAIISPTNLNFRLFLDSFTH